MAMFDLLYSSKNFRKTRGSFWNYYPDIPNSGYNNNNNRDRIFYLIKGSKSFDYKTKLVGTLGDNLPTVPATAKIEDIKIIVPLKM